MNFTEFHFLRPYWLLTILPYLLIMILILRHKLGRGNWSRVCDAGLLPYILEQRPNRKNRWPQFAAAAAALLCIIALAGPAWERLPAPVFRNASALIIILDLSRSMDAADIKPSRLVRARYKIADILKQRKDGQTALLVYAADVFTVTPLTDDTETINSQLAALTTQIMPAQGSNTALALEKSVQLFKQSGLQKGQILLVTDGVALDDALSTAQSLGSYELSVLGVGTEAGAPIKMPEGGFLKDTGGSIVLPRLVTRDLQQLATAGGGVYQAITTDNQDVASILTNIESTHELQQGQENDLMLDLWQERGPWLLFLVLPLAASLFRRGIFCMALMMLVPVPKTAYAFEWQDLWKTQNQQAQQAYQQQQFEQAAEQFTDPAWKAAAQYNSGQYDKVVDTLQDVETTDSYYNQGNALAKSAKLQDAIKAYEQSLKLETDTEDAKYNKEQVEKELQKQQQNSEQNAENNNQGQQQDANSKQSEQAENQQQGSETGSQQSANQSDEDQDGEQQAADEQQDQDDQQTASKAQQTAADDQAVQQEQQQASEAVDADKTEMQQANEQWLKRIPDDPAGLLRRKFKYQYGKRQQQSRSKNQW